MATAHSKLGPGEFFQEYLKGTAASVSYFSNGQRAWPIYATLQLQNCEFLGAPRFHYLGGLTSICWPLPFSFSLRTAVIQLGGELAREFKLRGVFGIDFIIAQEKDLWLLEVNPRFTASLGLFDRFFDGSLVECHAQACRNKKMAVKPRPAFEPEFRAGAVLYARDEFHITDRMSDRLWALRRDLDLADLPIGGSAIGKGHPVLTIYAEGDTREETMKSLEEKANQLRALGVP
jgi:uncharacterized protein